MANGQVRAKLVLKQIVKAHGPLVSVFLLLLFILGVDLLFFLGRLVDIFLLSIQTARSQSGSKKAWSISRFRGNRNGFFFFFFF